MTLLKTLVLVLSTATLASCGQSPQGTVTSHYNYGGGGGGGSSAPDMDRLRSSDLSVGETQREDTTPNNDGEQGTNAGHNSDDQDSFGKPGKISG